MEARVIEPCKALARFSRDESGAGVIDWVLLTAGSFALSLAVMTIVSGGVEDLTGETSASLVAMEVGPEAVAPVLSTEEVALSMDVDNRSDDWKRNRAERMGQLTDAQLQRQLDRWRGRTPQTSNHSQARIDFEIAIREAELANRG